MKIPDAKAQSVKDAIIKAMTRKLPNTDLKKITCQTYDGAFVMQGCLSGFQERIRSDNCPFAINLHFLNYQLQLSVKVMNKGHNLVSRITDNCKIIVKLINCSPKQGASMERVKI